MVTSQSPSLNPAHFGVLFVISGPAGVGKGTVLNTARPHLGHLLRSISATTRKPRPAEREGVDYFFVSPEEFSAMVARGDFLEHAEVHAGCYGTPADWVRSRLKEGVDVVLEIDVQGGRAVRAAHPGAVLIFIAPPSWEELERRIRGRNTEDDATIRRRLANARDEMRAILEYDYLVVNDVLDDAVASVCAVVRAERCRTRRLDLHSLSLAHPQHG